MGFEVAADGYDRFIGRYSLKLAPRFADFAGVVTGPALDVGCGPGALVTELAERLGEDRVAGVDLSEQFVAAGRARVPGADIRLASAEALPFATGAFAVALSQLVVSFVPNPEQMASEMTRVVRGGGTVAFCTFEANGFALVRAFWDAALRFDPRAPDDARMPFRRSSELVELCERAHLRDLATAELLIEASYSEFDDLWSPFSFGIGPAAEYLQAQDPPRRAAIREACFDLLGRPSGKFTLPAKVIAVRGRTGD
jgi:ubiquinone/menaquinone biosynthesis C-methylase UbiE